MANLSETLMTSAGAEKTKGMFVNMRNSAILAVAAMDVNTRKQEICTAA
jgi:hypothetical protein